MWDTLLNVNSALLTLAVLYFLYALGIGILEWTWKPFVIALLITLFLGLTELILGALAE